MNGIDGMIMKYKNFYTCPSCDALYSFVSIEKVSNKSTFETSCSECGIQTMSFYKRQIYNG